MSNPFQNSLVRDWYFDRVNLPDDCPILIATTGSGPFDEDEFDEFLMEFGLDVVAIDSDTVTLVIGRDDWDEEEILELLDQRKNGNLKVYSQEMFLAYLASGFDPFHEDEELLYEFGKGHRALEFLSSNGFDWPTTFVAGGGSTPVENSSWPQIGMLKAMGYKVGSNGLTTATRRQILKNIFETSQLPNVCSVAYVTSWGRAGSSQRLEKMADSIAAFCSLAKRRSNPPYDAIRDWEHDLEWLKATFYTGRFRFQWPSTYYD